MSARQFVLLMVAVAVSLTIPSCARPLPRAAKPAATPEKPAEKKPTTLSDIASRDLDWADYDGDGDLDLVLVGDEFARVYRNDGDVFADVKADIGDSGERVAWGDYDADGDPDLVIAAWWSEDGTVLYRNDRGELVRVQADLEPSWYCSLDWGDYDGDGDLDLLIAGGDMSGASANLYRNEAGRLTRVDAALPPFFACAVAFGDYDRDGDADLAIAGDVEFSVPCARIYRSGRGRLTGIGAGLTAVRDCALAWGDYDRDGDLDLTLAGSAASGPILAIYRSHRGRFRDIGAGPPGITSCSLAWADYDSDGDLDLAASGTIREKAGEVGVTRLYRNDQGKFIDVKAGLHALGRVVWADYDGDGDPDLTVSGSTTMYGDVASRTRIFRNDSGKFTKVDVKVTEAPATPRR